MSDPGPPAKPPRSALTVRDMVGAMVVLVVLALLFAGATRSCAFSPGGPTVDPSAGPRVDAPAQLRALADNVDFAVRIPAVPPGWRSNAVDRADVEGGQAVRVGYLTPQGRYLRLVQSDAPEGALLAAEADDAPVARGTVEVAGQVWVVYDDGTGEPIRIATGSGPDGATVRWLVTGSGSEADFVALAGATQTGELLVSE